MSASTTSKHPSIYLLGDHLDAALAMGEDLLAEKVVLADAAQPLNTARLVQQNRELAKFLTIVRTLEMSLTAPLVDAAMELGDTTVRDFNTGDTAFAFLRSRALIACDAAGLERLSELRVGEDYLVAGRIRLGTLLDLVATFLDSLDLIYDLYGEPSEPEAMPPLAQDTGTVETSQAT